MSAPAIQLSAHFTLEEFAVSASFPKLVVPVPESYIPNYRRLAATLERFRPDVGPMRILSGYRSGPLNRSVGGSPTSQHMVGEACDVSPADPEYFFRSLMMADDLGHQVGQCIWYPDKRFVHVALPSSRFPVPTPCVHWPAHGFRYQPIPMGKAGVQWLRDHGF